MGSKEQSGSDLVDNIRNMSISRRGGIRTRGGRLPPIRMREIAPVTGAIKKVIAPKIPQRRTAVKKEVSEAAVRLIKKEPRDDFSRERGRGRGRGAKVFLQMEGTFLADGPAARAKRERDDFESCAIPRSSKSSAGEASRGKVDPEAIRDLLSFYEANDAYENDFGTIAPYRLPLLNDELDQKVKVEPVKIKTEPLDEDDTGAAKKGEEDPWNIPEGKFFTRIKTEFPSAAEEFYNVKDEGMLILLQWPSCLPFAKEPSDVDSKVEDKNKPSEPQAPPSFIDNLEEGRIGKLQVLKSGRKRLVLGSIAFELVDGTKSESFKEAVSIRADDLNRDLTVVGKIDRTMLVRPLLKDIVGGDIKDY